MDFIATFVCSVQAKIAYVHVYAGRREIRDFCSTQYSDRFLYLGASCRLVSVTFVIASVLVALYA